MKTAALAGVVAALLSTTVRAEGVGDALGPRIGVEAFAGSLGAASLGLAGGLILAPQWGFYGVSLGLVGPIALGSGLGTLLGGSAMCGQGNWGATFGGTLVGSNISLLLLTAMAPFPELFGWQLAMMIALPVAGGVLGYEISYAMRRAGLLGRVRNLRPSLALSHSGKTALAGLTGTF